MENKRDGVDELSQAKSTVSLESSAPVPEDALGLMQKND